MPSVIEPILERLKADDSVTALVADRIFPGMAPQGTDLPRVTFTVIANEPLNHMGPSQLADHHATMQVDCWAASYDVAYRVRSAVNNSLAGHRDRAASPPIDSILQLTERDLPEDPQDGSDEPIHRISQDYSIWYREV